MSRALRAKRILAVDCPTCGAEPKQECELGGGVPRNTSHRDRRLAAKDGDPYNGMWIKPNTALETSRRTAERDWKAWSILTGRIPSRCRYLELADIALGVEKSD
jgi:hypothetical protein